MVIAESKKTIKAQFIFWCYTAGHEEDWFIQANSKLEAQEAHANFEGFDTDEVKSRKICEVPPNLHIKAPNWPKPALLKKLGFELLQVGQPRKVRYNGQLFTEGTLIERITANKQFKKPQTYLIKVRGGDFYKIGFSSNLYRRKKEILGNSPFHLDVIDTIITPLAKSLESEIRAHFKKFISANEWITLDDWGALIVRLLFELYKYEFQNCSLKHKASLTFKLLLHELKKIIDESIYKIKPREESVATLNVLYKLVEAYKSQKKALENADAIASHILNLEAHVDSLKSEIITKHCPFKVGDIITRDNGQKYLIQEVEVYILKDTSRRAKSKNKITYICLGYPILKNGSVGKRSESFFQ